MVEILSTPPQSEHEHKDLRSCGPPYMIVNFTTMCSFVMSFACLVSRYIKVLICMTYTSVYLVNSMVGKGV